MCGAWQGAALSACSLTPHFPCITLPHCPSRCVIYDPEVKSDQIFRDMSTPKFEWDRPNYSKSASRYMENVQVRQNLHLRLPQAVTIEREDAEGHIGLM